MYVMLGSPGPMRPAMDFEVVIHHKGQSKHFNMTNTRIFDTQSFIEADGGPGPKSLTDEMPKGSTQEVMSDVI